MSVFTLDEFNTFLQTVLKEKTFQEQDSKRLQCLHDADCAGYYYIDFLNIFCFLNGVRNGAHLDQIQSAGHYRIVDDQEEDACADEDTCADEDEDEDEDDMDDDMDITTTHSKNTFTDELLTELTRLSLTRFPWIRFNKRYELTLWNSDKVPAAAVLNSWAFEGDYGKGTETHADYWKNTALLLGNDKGYPTMTSDPATCGTWSLKLVINLDGISSPYPFSMAGGIYDTTNKHDLDSIRDVKAFLKTLIHKPLYHPDGRMVFLEAVLLHVKKGNKFNF